MECKCEVEDGKKHVLWEGHLCTEGPDYTNKKCSPGAAVEDCRCCITQWWVVVTPEDNGRAVTECNCAETMSSDKKKNEYNQRKWAYEIFNRGVIRRRS